MFKSIWQERLILLKNRNFRYFLLSSLAACFGGSMCYITLTWYILSISNHVGSVILASLAFWGPTVIFGPFCGVFIDRYSRKNLLVFCCVARFVTFGIIGLLLFKFHSLLLCYLLQILNGVIWATLGPAIMAFVRELVSDDELLMANTTCDMVYEVGNVVGASIAGLFLIVMSPPMCLMIVTLLSGMAALLLFGIKQNPDAQHHLKEHRHFLQDFMDGLVYLKSSPKLATIYLLHALIFTQFMITPILLAPFVKNILHGNSMDFGLIETSLGVSLIIGSFMLPFLSKLIGWSWCVAVGLIMMSGTLLFFSLNHSMIVAGILYFIIGFCLPIWTLVVSRAQSLTEKHYQGRVSSTYSTLCSLIILLVYLSLYCLGGQSTALVHFYWLCSGVGVAALGFLLIVNLSYKRNEQIN